MKSADNYKKGTITISEAAHRAELTVWKMEKYLIDPGFISHYSIDDVKEELKNIRYQ